MKPEEICVGATYRRPHNYDPVVIVTHIGDFGVSYTNPRGNMIGSSSIESFARDATRIYPNRPSVEEVLRFIEQMEPEQREQIRLTLSNGERHGD
jgi:hypothetical protein